MDIKQAETRLTYDTLKDDGTYTKLRLGITPDPQAIRALSHALQLICEYYAEKQDIPRKVAFPCAVILNFSKECIRNLETAGSEQATIYDTMNLAHDAFRVLADGPV